jgi:hypothetical protein
VSCGRSPARVASGHRVSGGDGDIRFTVQLNPLSAWRQGVLMVGDRALTVIQKGRLQT